MLLRHVHVSSTRSPCSIATYASAVDLPFLTPHSPLSALGLHRQSCKYMAYGGRSSYPPLHLSSSPPPPAGLLRPLLFRCECARTLMTTMPACLPAFARGVFPLTSLCAFLVHDAVAALTALDRILRLDKVVRSTVCTTRGFFYRRERDSRQRRR